MNMVFQRLLKVVKFFQFIKFKFPDFGKYTGKKCISNDLRNSVARNTSMYQLSRFQQSLYKIAC